MFAKPSKGVVKKIDINFSMENLAKLLEHQYSLANVKILREYAPSVPAIAMDEKQMHEVFMNLLNNSFDAMPKGGTITVKTSTEADNLRIDITDTGTGIPEEHMKKMFQPFFTTKEKGTGLGLPVCYGIIKVHGGELKLTSEAGKGTTATILLPIRGGYKT